jgi:hypothetical protein
VQKLYEAADRVEAQLLIDHLAARRIRAVMLGDYLSGAAGDLPALMFPTVWLIDDDDLALASRCLAEFHARFTLDIDRPGWRCPSCGTELEGQFALCWRCGAPRP